jgi:hypothetical protein
MNPFEQVAKARANGGKPAWRQLSEAVRLRLARNPLGIGEYFDYGIWHASITPERMREFIGWRQSAALDKQLNADYSRVLANDKLLNYLILQAAGYRIPNPIATYTRDGRRIGNERVLQSIEAVRSFLYEAPYPFYVKPISAGYGRGVLGVAGLDGQRLRLMDDSQIEVDDFLAPFAFAPYQGMLFQQPLVAHPVIVELTGSKAICCVRFICFVTASGPVIHTAFWKIIAGRNMLDNFAHGDYGNCLVAIDIDTGKVVRAIAHLGPGGQIDRHPGTQKLLSGFLLPDWEKALALVHSVARHFPGLRLQNWDVALCPEGPVLLELNTESELAIPQAISGRGLMDQRLRDILAELEQADRACHQALTRGPPKPPRTSSPEPRN